MPELPDLTVYCEALTARIGDQPLLDIRLGSPFVLRSVEPSPASLRGRQVHGIRLLGKRIVVELAGGSFIVVHLMIAGRLHWKPAGAKLPARRGLAAFDFAVGTLHLTEAGSQRRASIHLVPDASALAEYDRGGIDPLTADVESFAARLRSENHTLKRSLTDPRLFAGIGNAYSDEILHRARLSPMNWSTRLSDAEVARLRDATQATLIDWTSRLRAAAGGDFPEKVTAFRAGMAVHGRFGLPCPDCGNPVQRIRYASNETNYCPPCQTEGRLLADRSLSRLLRDDWPRSLEALDERLGREPPAGVGR